jgi:hypothetical protein
MGVKLAVEGGIVLDGHGAAPRPLDLHIVRGVIVAAIPRAAPDTRGGGGGGGGGHTEWFSAAAAAAGEEPCMQMTPRTARVAARGCVVLPIWFVGPVAVAAGQSFATAFRAALATASMSRLADAVTAVADIPTGQRYVVRRGDRAGCVVVEVPAGLLVGPETTCGELLGCALVAVVVDGVPLPATARVTAGLSAAPLRELVWPNQTGVAPVETR